MNFFTILPAFFALAALTVATPIKNKNKEKGCTSESVLAANVTGSITQWSSDIDGVNTFVDTIGNCSSTVMAKSMAQTALGFAQDEGAQLNVLKVVPGLDASGEAAVGALPNLFNGIGGSIQAIIDDPSPASVASNVANINNLRCATAISDEGAVWAAAAAAVGASAPEPNRPAACNQIAKK